MRNAFADEITKLGTLDKRVTLLSGDIGNKLFDNFKANSPGRFFNCGVAEANMMGMAAGLALNGLRPVVYTITPFTTTRCYEQISRRRLLSQRPGGDRRHRRGSFVCRSRPDAPLLRGHRTVARLAGDDGALSVRCERIARRVARRA